MGGFGVILMPKTISTTTTLDYFEIYVTLLKNMVQNFKKFTTISKHGTKLQKFHKILKQGIEKRCISSAKKSNPKPIFGLDAQNFLWINRLICLKPTFWNPKAGF